MFITCQSHEPSHDYHMSIHVHSHVWVLVHGSKLVLHPLERWVRVPDEAVNRVRGGAVW